MNTDHSLNLSGANISNAVAVQVADVGIAPVANLSDTSAMFEAAHCTLPRHSGRNKVNPGSIILSAEKVLKHRGRGEVDALVINGLSGAINGKTLTRDLAQLMDKLTPVACSGLMKPL